VAFECVFYVFLIAIWRKMAEKVALQRNRGLTIAWKAVQSLAFDFFMETESTQRGVS
jgi:hypothetical protein